MDTFFLSKRNTEDSSHASLLARPALPTWLQGRKDGPWKRRVASGVLISLLLLAVALAVGFWLLPRQPAPLPTNRPAFHHSAAEVVPGSQPADAVEPAPEPKPDAIVSVQPYTGDAGPRKCRGRLVRMPGAAFPASAARLQAGQCYDLDREAASTGPGRPMSTRSCWCPSTGPWAACGGACASSAASRGRATTSCVNRRRRWPNGRRRGCHVTRLDAVSC